MFLVVRLEQLQRRSGSQLGVYCSTVKEPGPALNDSGGIIWRFSRVTWLGGRPRQNPRSGSQGGFTVEAESVLVLGCHKEVASLANRPDSSVRSNQDMCIS